MSSATKTPVNIGHFLAVDQEYPAPKIVAENALLKDFKAEYQRSIKDIDAFWADIAKQFVWTKPWTKVSEWDGGTHKWFLGARTNITVNALDRHAKGGGANRVAHSAHAGRGNHQNRKRVRVFGDRRQGGSYRSGRSSFSGLTRVVPPGILNFAVSGSSSVVEHRLA